MLVIQDLQTWKINVKRWSSEFQRYIPVAEFNRKEAEDIARQIQTLLIHGARPPQGGGTIA